jgi:hypothetical protein
MFLDVRVGTVLQLHPEGTNGQHDSTTTEKVTIGKQIGRGKEGSVYGVTSHEFGDHELVAKHLEFHSSARRMSTAMKEIKNLRMLGQLRGSIMRSCDSWILMDKIPGEHLENTQEYLAAYSVGQRAVNAVVVSAAKLVSDARFRYANEYGLVHKCVFWSEMSFAVAYMTFFKGCAHRKR